ncbi:putative fungal Zn(2)-cys(6) binuclear cluster domain protein [Rhizoctonia solani 123E]|uniref:Putative fungal Zn(2)-cys(6) binuclear cluster domain protein n=1 Tax=Rhizoctonia solani 123E TaxID=1423351 RepID=A0A074RJJ8_9AGAM|nr:putative fungal Zn(2)-cys(6) binuclear cluster domain protein [Rhizoctonia solani 123E]
MKQKRIPGPAGTSCLTCKRRRKKCDQGRPACKRCTEGHFDCLGYDHIQRRKAAEPDEGTSQSESTEDVIPAPVHADRDNSGFGSGRQQSLASLISQPLVASSYGYSEAPFYEATHTGYITLVDDQPDLASTNPYLSLAAVNNPPWGVSPHSSPFASSSEYEENHPSAFHLSSGYYSSLLIGAQTARTLSTLSPDMRRLFHHVFNLYDQVLDSVYFKPKDHQVAKMRQMVASRLQASSITRCAIVLVVQMVESMLNGNAQCNRPAFKQSVERFENQLQKVKAQHPNPVQVHYLLSGFLEAAFLKMRISNGYRAYQLLQNAAPVFMELVYSDPSLWPDPNGPPMVCMSKVAASTRFELGHFTLIDTVCSMAYGLPQVVQYETATPSLEPEIHPIEWVHCCPLEFQVCLAEMNKCCAKSYVAPDWRAIEHRLVSYKAPVVALGNTESWKAIARIAVVESWRQVLLIYLYMAVCGVSSDDPRVQSSVRQIFQLFKIVKREEPPKVNAHFMVQYLVAGACTRSEKQRAFARERLLNAFDNECWVLPGCELVPVLDHLWHGAAANGQPFKWSDYIMSRQAVLPIPI